MADLNQTLVENPEDLLIPNEKLQRSALEGIKNSLDPIAQKYSIFDTVHIDGLDAEQVWAQAQMIVDGAVDKLFSKLSDLTSGIPDEAAGSEGSEEQDSEDLESLSELDGEQHDSELENVSQDEHEDIDDSELEEEVDHEAADASQDEEEEDVSEGEGPDSLNKGLFNLADFQQQVLAMEKEPEDDDEIDYFNEVEDSESDGEAHFEDFFAPPAKHAKKRLTKADKQAFAEDEELDQVMDSTKKDLFGDEDESEPEEDGEQLSKHERQQLELEKQIRQLEDENVGAKFWAAKGEVRASQRPQDSLINTELEFDRNAKPAPVVTQEVTNSLEEMIRDRIKNEKFDDIPKRLPPQGPRKSRELPEVSESKSTKSLAELYEEDKMREENPDYYQQKDNAVVDAAHKEIADMYNELSRKLDALSSWHYTPKPAQESISIVTDAPAISMEEAQPVAMASGSMLAPQEVYVPSKGNKAEVVGRDNLPVSRDELSREDKHKARRKAKAQKARANAAKQERERARAAAEPKAKRSSKDKVFETLEKGNVTFMDKRGTKRDLRGNEVTDAKKTNANHLKL